MEYIILWVLALFGLWSLVSNISESLWLAAKEGSFDVVLSVCNQEDTIELLIKQLSRIDMVRKIKVIDNGSTDNTIKIVEKMKNNNFNIILEKNT